MKRVTLHTQTRTHPQSTQTAPTASHFTIHRHTIIVSEHLRIIYGAYDESHPS